MSKQKTRRLFLCALLFIAILYLLNACGFPGENEVYLPDNSGCLLYSSNDDGSEGIHMFCPDNASRLLIPGDQIIDFVVSNSSGVIIYSALIDSGEGKVYQTDLDGKREKNIYDCGKNVCENLAVHPFENAVIFSIMGETPYILHIDLHSGFEAIIEYGAVGFIDISPDGRYLRYFLDNEGKLRVFDLERMVLHATWNVDNDLIGGWSPEGTSFLIGARDVEGQLGRNVLKEVAVPDSKETVLFELPGDMDISQAIYRTENNFIVLTRAGVKTNTRQIIEVDRNGNIVREISNQPVFNHSSLNWNEAFQRLAFQRYDVTSSRSTPEVWIWDMDMNAMQMVAENASSPRWLP